MNLISVANMVVRTKKSRRAPQGKKDGHRKSRPTEADLAAAARLKAIRDAMPAGARPTQEQIIEAFDRDISQSAISQMMNGVIAMTFEAVLVFARMHKCAPRDIRDDLPELKALRLLGWSEPRGAREDASAITDWPFSPALRLRLDRLNDKQREFVEKGVESAISLCEASGGSPAEKSTERSA